MPAPAAAPAHPWKLRYAAHLGINPGDGPLFAASAASADPLDQIRYAAQLGIAGIADNNAIRRPPAQLCAMGEEIARLGLTMGCIANTRRSTRESLWGRPGPEVRTALAEELAESIAAARRLGTRHLVTVCKADPVLPAATQRANLVENLRAMADLADKAGMLILLEATAQQRMPGMILQHCTDLLAVLRAVNAPSVRMVFDVCHCQYMDGNLTGNLDACWADIDAIQIADVPGRLPPGSGEIAFPYVLRNLHERGYQGLVELECYLGQPGLAAEQALLATLASIDRQIAGGH